MATVFRFSDFQANTYKEHRNIAERTGGVWWGWWKKEHEVFPAGPIRAIQASLARGPVVIGLINRSGVYLSAECSEIALAGGRAIKSPLPHRTPSYYSANVFPLWLYINAFTELSESAWIARFGPVPVGDDTFFSDNPGNLEVLETDPATRLGHGLLHISDLHFGSDYAFANDDGQFFSRKPLEVRIAEALPTRPAGIIVSGDLTTRGDNNGLVEARLFLERLAAVVDLPHDRVVIAPGNHDILVNDPAVTKTFENEQHFRTQMMEFYGERVDLERIQEFVGLDGIHYVFVVLNSSRPRDVRTMNYGYVGRDRSEPILTKASNFRDGVTGPSWLGLVLHHHILPAQQIEYAVPDRPVSLAIDAGELVGMAADLGFDGILHGHEHLPFVGKTARIAEFGGYERRQIGFDRSVTVLACGSTSARVDRLTDEMRYNSFNFYEITETAVRVQLFEFSARIDPRVPLHWDFEVSR